MSVLAGGTGSGSAQIHASELSHDGQRLRSIHPDSAFGWIEVEQHPTRTAARARAAYRQSARTASWAGAYVVFDAGSKVGDDSSDDEVTFVNCLELDPGLEDAAFERWKEINDHMVDKPGYRSHVLRRRLDDGVPFGFVNIVRWESMESLAAARDERFAELVRDLPFVPRPSWCRPVWR